MSNVNVMITPKSATVNFDGMTTIVPTSNPKYAQVIECYRNNDFDGIKSLFNEAQIIKDKYGLGVSFKDGIATINGEDLPYLLSARLVEFAKQSLPYEHLVRFWNRLKNNPSAASVNELFDMLERNNHPILPDGRFLAWKAVQSDFMSKTACHKTGKRYDNHPGQKPEMERRMIDDDRRNECSFGLHVGSIEYVRDYFYNAGDKIVEVAVDPADAVSVPTDHSFMKMRVWRYEVLREVNRDSLRGENYGLTESYSDEYEDEYDYEEDCYGDDDDEDYNDRF